MNRQNYNKEVLFLENPQEGQKLHKDSLQGRTCEYIYRRGGIDLIITPLFIKKTFFGIY